MSIEIKESGTIEIHTQIYNNRHSLLESGLRDSLNYVRCTRSSFIILGFLKEWFQMHQFIEQEALHVPCAWSLERASDILHGEQYIPSHTLCEKFSSWMNPFDEQSIRCLSAICCGFFTADHLFDGHLLSNLFIKFVWNSSDYFICHNEIEFRFIWRQTAMHWSIMSVKITSYQENYISTKFS